MYDAKSEPNEFFGESRSEAVAKASRFFGIEESELAVKEPGAGEIFGLFDLKARKALPLTDELREKAASRLAED